MKTVMMIVAAIAMTATTAEASFMQEFCSNAEGTVRTAQGHNEGYLELTKRTYNMGGYTDKKLKDTRGRFVEEVVSEQEIQSESGGGCFPGQEYGFGWSDTVTVKKIVIKNKNGALFPKEIVGVSEDRKTVNAYLICNLHVSSEMYCEE